MDIAIQDHAKIKNYLLINIDNVYAATSNEQDKNFFLFNLKSAEMPCEAEKCGYTRCEIKCEQMRQL